MFEINSNLYLTGLSETPRHLGDNNAFLLKQAINLFNQSRWCSLMDRLKSYLLRQARFLLDIESIPASSIRARHYAGIQTVSINRICGTLGRSSDFDGCFRPLNDRIRNRWIRIAMARHQHIPLAPVSLIQIGDRYFVQDGHHRISVASAFGESAIEAEVTIWDVAAPFPWESKPIRRTVQQLA